MATEALRTWTRVSLQGLISSLAGNSGGVLEQGPLNRLGHLDGGEAAGGVEVILTAFVNDSKVTIPGRVRIRDYGINLVQLQRRLVI